MRSVETMRDARRAWLRFMSSLREAASPASTARAPLRTSAATGVEGFSSSRAGARGRRPPRRPSPCAPALAGVADAEAQRRARAQAAKPRPSRTHRPPPRGRERGRRPRACRKTRPTRGPRRAGGRRRGRSTATTRRAGECDAEAACGALSPPPPGRWSVASRWKFQAPSAAGEGLERAAEVAPSPAVKVTDHGATASERPSASRAVASTPGRSPRRGTGGRTRPRARRGGSPCRGRRHIRALREELGEAGEEGAPTEGGRTCRGRPCSGRGSAANDGLGDARARSLEQEARTRATSGVGGVAAAEHPSSSARSAGRSCARGRRAGVLPSRKSPPTGFAGLGLRCRRRRRYRRGSWKARASGSAKASSRADRRRRAAPARAAPRHRAASTA